MGWLLRVLQAISSEVRQEWWPFLVFFAGPLAALLLAFTAGGLLGRGGADQVRYFGTWLQLFGIVLVAAGVHELRRDFKLPGLLEFLRQSKERIARRLRPTPLEARSATATISTGALTVKAHASVGGTIEQRLDHLERTVDALQAEVDQNKRDSAKEITAMRGRLEQESKARSDDHAALAEKIDRVAVGGLHLEIVGLLWLLIATITTSLPDGVAWMLHFVRGLFG